MQAQEDMTDETEQSQAPVGGSSHQGTPLRADSESDGPVVESDAYSAAEEALVEERLKNLGYL